MRFLVKATVPIEAGNKAIKEGTLSNTIRRVMEELKPEAAYFFEEDGHRTSLFVLNLEKASDIPRIAEPFFLGANAEVRLHPVMTAEDLAAAGLEELAKKWG
jgi:hypothetical protein